MQTLQKRYSIFQWIFYGLWVPNSKKKDFRHSGMVKIYCPEQELTLSDLSKLIKQFSLIKIHKKSFNIVKNGSRGLFEKCTYFLLHSLFLHYCIPTFLHSFIPAFLLHSLFLESRVSTIFVCLTKPVLKKM